MDVDQALKLLDSVISEVTLTRQMHTNIVVALRVLEKATRPASPGEEE